MTLKPEKLEDLASILYAFENPDSELPDLVQGSKEFNKEIAAQKAEYEAIPAERKTSLRGAVAWFLCQNPNELESLVPDLYRRIWTHQEDIKMSEEIIRDEIDPDRYIAAMKYILMQPVS